MKNYKTKLTSICILLVLIGVISSNMIAYADPPNLNITIPGNNPTPPCTEGQTSANSTLLCQNGTNVLCDASKEGTKSNDGTLVCKSGKWQAVSSPTPNPNPSTPTAKITNVTVVPSSFKPATESTKISYTTSLKAIIDIKITNGVGQTVGNLVDNITLAAGSYFVNWYGTNDNKQGGMILNSGTYHYKIVAKNTKTNNVEDSKEGDISLIYVASNPESPTTDTATKQDQAAQANATMILQNTKKGTTSKTGPDILIYSAFPVIGYLVARRRK